MARRPLTGREKDEARRVFGDSLSFDRVVISNRLGLGRRAWVNAGLQTFTIHLGPYGFAEPLRTGAAPTFIHELVHVWQGQHGRTRYDFMLGSIACQCRAFLTCLDVRAAYRYDAGGLWRDYNVEQQASIVEHWYRAGLKETDPLFAYIHDHIRKGAT